MWLATSAASRETPRRSSSRGGCRWAFSCRRCGCTPVCRPCPIGRGSGETRHLGLCGRLWSSAIGSFPTIIRWRTQCLQACSSGCAHWSWNFLTTLWPLTSPPSGWMELSLSRQSSTSILGGRFIFRQAHGIRWAPRKSRGPRYRVSDVAGRSWRHQGVRAMLWRLSMGRRTWVGRRPSTRCQPSSGQEQCCLWRPWCNTQVPCLGALSRCRSMQELTAPSTSSRTTGRPPNISPGIFGSQGSIGTTPPARYLGG
mmetsp:Transcript_95029/g.204025  ORF Transcript_95029/g.204025 Transcript_95029/m.204025 type:complete len:255 (+) Transcript_95029:1024-1788(+)